MDPGQATLNDFQKRLEERLNAALKGLGVQVDSRRVGWEEVFSPRRAESVVHVRARDLDVRIREDSVSFTLSGKGEYYEMPDYQSPDALADSFLGTLSTRFQESGRVGPATDPAGGPPR
ncbi:MAG: hypothetical protein ABR998_05995 [Gemmatimonadales bacterium]|jgi:hypothetical protein